MPAKKAQLIGGIVLLTLGSLIILDLIYILPIETSWPLLLVAAGVGIFLSRPNTFAGWIVGGIGIIYFMRNFLIDFFPEVETWSYFVWPTILIIIGALLLYRYYRVGSSPKAPGPRQENIRVEEQGPKPEELKNKGLTTEGPEKK